jgi:hypothetical protein
MCIADEMRGQSDHVAPALSLDELREILAEYRDAFSATRVTRRREK